ncbi:MAG: RecX family transcriptional regulator [Clostridiales Family XIII bacterium]|jgi:regulatory protein|nr:RecX family transcriptional regulator [Clostridiales Family XIII bacterium]
MTDEQGKKTPERPAFDMAADFLARRMRAEREVRKFLDGRGIDEGEADEAIDRLKELGYIDDRAYATRYLEILVGRKRGRKRIKDEMRRRGLDAGLVEEILCDGYTEPAERENALRVAEKAMSALPEGVDAREAARKLSSRLVWQGYDYDLIDSVVGELLKQ